MHLDLDGKVVAVTGGARGIGLATARAFAARGAVVAIGDLDAAGTGVAAETIGRGAVGLALDVTDRASFESFLNEVELRLGPLDILVNNAGIQHVGMFADESDASADIQIAVNLGGVLTGTKLALARMRRRGGGHIVNVASVGGKIASPGGATYAATKHAVVGLSESLRGELRGTGMAVSVVLPAMIATEMAEGLGSARGMPPLKPSVAGEAIVRAVERGRGVDVYVPGYAGAINTAISVMPRNWRDKVLHFLRSDTVLIDIDQFGARKIQATTRSGRRIACDWTQISCAGAVKTNGDRFLGRGARRRECHPQHFRVLRHRRCSMIKLGYGLITCQTHPDDPRDWQALYIEALELAKLAESSGAESIWVSEHHFTDDGYLPALLPLMSALGAVTTTASIAALWCWLPSTTP